MTKLMEKALETVRQLPPEQQDDRAMLTLAGDEGELEEINPEYLSDVLESLAQRRRNCNRCRGRSCFPPLGWKLRFTPRATANLLEIADYLNARNPAAAQRVPRRQCPDGAQNLILFPHIGRKQKVEGVRKLVSA